jgi:hypothetical protein
MPAISSAKRRIPKPVELSSEWGDQADVRKVFGLRGTNLYQLRKEGKVKTALVLTGGRRGGKRLYCFASIRALLAQAAGE